MKDRDLILLLLLLAWFWLSGPKKTRAGTTSTTNQTGTGSDLINTLGNIFSKGVDTGSNVLNSGSTQTAGLINSIVGSGTSGTSGTANAPNNPAVLTGAAPSPPFVAGIADNNPVGPSQNGYTPFNNNPPEPISSIVFIQSGPSDPWQGGYDLISYADGSISEAQHIPGQYPKSDFTPLLNSAGQPVAQQVP